MSGANRGVVAGSTAFQPLLGGAAMAPEELTGLVDAWEDVLTVVVDPDSAKPSDPARSRRFLDFLLDRAGIDGDAFWSMTRGQRGRLFLSHYSRLSRDVPELELTSFDIDKVAKERFRHEPLTLGAAWHFGFWRSYFSHAAITHPANDGLREEFSTAWLIGRREPHVLEHTNGEPKLFPFRTLRLDMPMIVGPLPHSDGVTLEQAYLRAAERADPLRDRKTKTLVVVREERLLAHVETYLEHAPYLMPRIRVERALRVFDAEPDAETRALDEVLSRVRIVELEWSDSLEEDVARLAARYSEALFSVYLENGEGFEERLGRAAATPGVALVHFHTGGEKSYRVVPRVDAHLKRGLLRARVQLVSAGGSTDTHASAASVYEAVLLGANGGAMTDIAALALVPELVDVYHGADPAPIVDGLAARDQEELARQAENTLTCWQHSILDFLSCMGIDDIQKTSGNQMAITITEDWMREVDALVTDEFGEQNRRLNDIRVAAEPVPADARETFRPSRLLDELQPDVGLVPAARILAQESASWHLANTNRSLTADFLEVIYRMAAGQLPTEDEFFLAGDLGLGSVDEVRVKLSRESLAWSLERLRRDPALLDYVSLATPRGFERPGAAQPGAEVRLLAEGRELVRGEADATGAFDVRFDAPRDGLAEGELVLWAGGRDIALVREGHGAHGRSVVAASEDGTAMVLADPRGGHRLVGRGIRERVWHGPVGHASISLGAASEDFLAARIEGNAGLAFTSSGEGGPIRVADEVMPWQSLQAASGHFGLTGRDLRRVRDVEIKINQGAKPGKGGRLSGAKVTPQVSRARNIPVGTNALSPDPKHDIYSIEDMPAEVWLWLGFSNHCGIKITGSNYTKYVAAGMWSNFVVDYLLIDSGMGGSGNYHADSSHVGWPDIFRTILHTHHALVNEPVDLEDSGELRPIRDLNGAPFGAKGGTRLFASGGVRGELDVLKILIAGADGVVEASIGKAVAFGCNQCGNCHLDCPRGGITTKPELMVQNQREVMARRFRNWTVLNLVKLAVLIDALNREHGALDADGNVVDPGRLIDDVRKLRGRVDLLAMPGRKPAPEKGVEAERDSCRVGSLTVSEPVTVDAIWEAARVSHNGGNNRGGGIGFAGFTPEALRETTALTFNTIGPDRVDTMLEILGHLRGTTPLDGEGQELSWEDVAARLEEFRLPVRPQFEGEDGWRGAGLREAPGDFYLFFVELDDAVLTRFGHTLLASEHWLQRRTKYGDVADEVLALALDEGVDVAVSEGSDETLDESILRRRLLKFRRDVREEYFSALGHVLDTRFYRTHPEPGEPREKYAAKRRGHLVSMGEDVGAIKLSGWTHVIPEYFDLASFWARYPGVADKGGVELVRRGRTIRTTTLHANVWGMHHRYPTNSPAIDAEGRGNPAGAHPFKSYNVLLMHNGEQVGVDATAPFLCEYGYVHTDSSMGPGHEAYVGDSIYERKALTDTEYAAYLVDFTRRVLGLDVEEASQIISPITGIDLEGMEPAHREKLRLLMQNYVQLTPTGPYKFTIIESLRRLGERIVGFRENMDIKFLRPHEIVSHRDLSPGGVEAVANGSEAKIADAMLRMLHAQGVLKDASCDLRFNMRQGGKPGLEEHGGVFEAFVEPAQLELNLVNRFGETVPVRRAGVRGDLSLEITRVERAADIDWMGRVDVLVEKALMEASELDGEGRLLGPDDALPPAGAQLVELALSEASSLSFHDYRYLAESVLPQVAEDSDAGRALALRVLTELRKRLLFEDLGHKALSSVEYITDGGRDANGNPEGGIYRILDAVPHLADAWGESRYVRITADTRDDLVAPSDAARDVLVVDQAGFASESFTLQSCSRFLSECVRQGWRNLVLFDARGGPRYLGRDFEDRARGGLPAEGVVVELYGREQGDFLGALLEGARMYLYGQAQSHVGFKADSGYVFVLQDALNTCLYSAHGGTFSFWDSGSRFAVAGQNKVWLDDAGTLAPGLKSIHFGTPNEYAFEYLMSGGENSLHVVLGLRKPNAKGELSLRPKPYAGKFLMSGAAAGRVVLLDPQQALDPAQHQGNVPADITPEEWADDIGPLIQQESDRRGAPIRVDGESISLKLDGSWRTWHYSVAFVKLVPATAEAELRAREIATSGGAEAELAPGPDEGEPEPALPA